MPLSDVMHKTHDAKYVITKKGGAVSRSWKCVRCGANRVTDTKKPCPGVKP